MGLIEKSIRKRANQKLAAPLATTTSLSRAEVVEAIKKLCASHNANSEQRARAENERAQTRGLIGKLSSQGSAQAWLKNRFHVSVQEKAILIGYGGTPESILALTGKRLSSSANHWLAQVTFPVRNNVPAGQTVVEITLLKWVIDQKGRVKSRGYYEGFCDTLFKAIKANSPASS